MTSDESQDGAQPPKQPNFNESSIQRMVTRNSEMLQKAASQHRDWARAVGANQELSKGLSQLANVASGILKPEIEQMLGSIERSVPDYSHLFNFRAGQIDAAGMQTLSSGTQDAIKKTFQQASAPSFQFRMPLSGSEAMKLKLLETMQPYLRQIQKDVNLLNRPATTSKTLDFLNGADGPRYRGNHWLWHYTNAQALDHILKQHTLWASSPHNLNDADELVHGVDFIRDAVVRVARNSENRDAATIQILNDVVEESYVKEAMHEIFYLSTSRVRDSLTLWRNYSTNTGFAIGLRPGRPEGRFSEDSEGDSTSNSPSTSHWYRVQYKERKKTALADSFVANAIKDIATAEPEDREIVIAELRKHMLVLASTMKHQAFEDEREVRWITTSWAPVHVVRYELTGRGFVPVLHVRTAGINGDDVPKLPIVGLRCAPTSSPTIERTMRGLLEHHKYFDAAENVLKSTMPFRG